MDILYCQAHIPEDPSLAQKAYALVDRLAERIPLWVMYCNQELDAAKVSYGAMSSTCPRQLAIP
jgi:hypothetical protein